jgi:DivIVA domain-containing protein
MIDETFHLTPLDARRYDFGKALRGYDPERVNQFRDQVAEELERLARINQELEAKARGFHEQLKAFRDRDKAINEALVSAQQLRGEIREQADKEAQLILREARAEGERMVEDARAEIRRMDDQLASLDRSRRAYLAQVRALVERQLSEITAAEQTPTSDNGSRGASPASSSWMGSLVKE